MSVSSLPEWKQLLLERKRREEEERERRGKEEEEKLANMPAWKRGIIQRRKAKQDSVGDRERERDVCLLPVEVRSTPSDGLSDTDSSVTANLGSDMSLSPDPGQWLDEDPRSVSQVSVETIVPLHENPFILTQSAWRKGRDADVGNESDLKEKERGQDMELKMERFRDLSEGREKERSWDRSQGRERDNGRERWENDKSQWKESVKDAMRDKEFLKGRKDDGEEETDSPSGSGSYSPLVPSLRTIRADNIIIIEQDRKGDEERRGRWREVEGERPEEEHQGKRGMKMDLREILAGKGSVTEIRASEVLIIKPSASPEERTTGGKGREDGETKCSMHVRKESNGRELRADMSGMREKEKEPVKGKERPWGQATVIKENRKDNLEDNMFVEKGGRVSQLLSKFGEHPKPPLRSKSSDNFLRPGRRKNSGDEDDQQSEERSAEGRNVLPKRSFSFSDRVISAKENGLDDERCYKRKTQEREHSDKRVAPCVDVADLQKETPAKSKVPCTRLLDKDRFGKCRDGYVKNDEKGSLQRRHEAEPRISIQNRSEVKKVEPIDTRAPKTSGDGGGDEGFMVASVKNTEGISFARRVPIRKEGKSRAEIEAKLVSGEKSLVREVSVEKEAEVGNTRVSDLVRRDEFESTIPPETLQNYLTAASTDMASPCLTDESHDRPDPSFTDCSRLLCTVTDRAGDPHPRPEWSGPHLTHSVLSWHADELIGKIEKIGDTTVYSNTGGEVAYRPAHELKKEITKEGQLYIDDASESLIQDLMPRSPKRIPPPVPLEIQIPMTVFYVAEDMVERKKTLGQNNEGQDWEGGQGVERRDSWRIGKPLSRIESLREKIRQRELEKLRQKEKLDGEGSVAAEISDCQTAGESYDERGAEIEEEWEAAAHVRKKLSEADTVQEDTAAQASMAAFDVTQEVLKMCPQLPVSVLHSQAVRGEEVTSGYATAATAAAAAAAAEVISDSSQTSEDDDEPLKHEEEQLRYHRSQHNSGEERETEEHELSEEEDGEEYISALNPTQPESLSPPHPNSLAAMSRIYNLETVGSRTGLCLRERTVDISPVHLVKVTPHISNAQQGENKTLSGEDICGVQKIQRQIEQFQLKEQEALKSYTSSNFPLRDRKTRQESPKDLLKYKIKDNVKTQEKDQSESKDKMSPQRVWSPTSQVKQTITINPSFLRSQSPDNSLKPLDCAPTPASSPSSLSPTQSPSDSPSPTPSPTLFSVRSASGGQVKRGATITISPKRHGAAGGGGGTGSTTGSTSTGPTPAATPSQQPQMSPAVAEPVKKKYPTVEEIEVIGGYQVLEKSSLVKNRAMPKRVTVCFDVDQLEQVYEYPSETSMLVAGLHAQDLGRQQGEGAQVEDADVDGGVITSKSTKIVGTAMGRGLRVDESCPRSSSPNLPL
ncbi:phostensin isoform X2 [Solea senegalensis]|uniref:Phostensin isoform X2 n=1 Tax=Solea senegalensis TaxID=28829 RepID=A0AAV6R8C3_SOLSE|nr:uncharacterized protein ppp1r18 isoform X1 [Solea senegalensis]XP_043908405.1 uncharacterized protein ppp1r18 isoform X2 [Solea senegalensis]XP_043908406.1 uncharacterized protein ppp1r18 isoform X1 [Solea senegalensis]XP_043908407.1 uncharacterized protein ppp1r18 isoform X3 [Solea senegalensis]XP_043908408.1 uncharacterized protein ppp1r18 isoform X2 [Solea senegalensis]KAG7500953.1 phostensin isoform X2 [Solea senegalensis]